MSAAVAPRRPAPDLELFKACKSRVTDYYAHNADTIRQKKTVTAAACIFEEMRLLCREVRKQDAVDVLEDKDRFVRIERQVARICEDYGDSIRTGAFVKISAAIFAMYRHLVRDVEAVLKRLLDVEEQFQLGTYIPDEHKARIDVSLDETPDGEDKDARDVPAIQPIRPIRPPPADDDDDNTPP